jgi:tetratricopeptide (TPR) repeat protein
MNTRSFATSHVASEATLSAAGTVPEAPVRATGVTDYSDEELETLYRQAHQLHYSGMHAKAHDLFYFIARCRPQSTRYCKALGVSLMSGGNYAAAVPVLTAAMRHDNGDDPALPVACAECLALTGQRRQARRLFEQARVMLQHQQALPEFSRLSTHTEIWLNILKDE